MTQYTYNYITADPGSGKTEWAIQYARRCIKLNPVLFVVPTKTLCDEIARRSGFIEAIHSGTVTTGPIGQHIQEVMAEVARTHRNRALVITDAAYSHLHIRHDSWIVIKDEPDEPLTIRLLNCEDSWRFVNEHVFEFCIHPTNDAFYTLRVRRPLTYSMRTELDSVFGPLFELTEYLTQDAFYEVLVDRDAWDLTHTLRYSVFQRPECWANWGEVYFMGANFEDSLIYNQWRHQGVTWVNRTPQRLQNMPTDRMHIHYLFDDMAWSARSRQRQFRGRTNLEWYLEWIRQELPTGNYVYVANNSLTDDQLKLNGSRMPAECHGLNAWRDHTNCVLMASYHQFQGDEMFYQYYKTSTTDIRGMRNTQYYVQQLTRTNIRNYDSTWPITVYVPTQREALDLLKYFREATIHTVTGDTYRLRPTWQPRALLPDTQPDVEGLTMGVNTYADAVLIGADHEIIQDEPQVIGTTRVTRVRAPGRPVDLKKGHPYLAFIMGCAEQVDITEFTGTREQFKRNHLPWFSPGIFRTGSRMVKENCIGASVLGFDFDDARFTDKELEEILRGVEHLIYTTISHDSTKPYRKIRVVVPLSRPVSISEHERLMAWYAWEFDRLRKGSLDESTLKAERKFYMPHSEADIRWVKKRKQPLNVDRLLLKIPKIALVQAPGPQDLVEVRNGVMPQQTNTGLIARINGIIDSMTAGDRSYKATRVGGMMRHLTADEREPIWTRLKMAGVDDAAIKSARKYAES